MEEAGLLTVAGRACSSQWTVFLVFVQEQRTVLCVERVPCSIVPCFTLTMESWLCRTYDRMLWLSKEILIKIGMRLSLVDSVQLQEIMDRCQLAT